MFDKIHEILEDKDAITIRIAKNKENLAVSVIPDGNTLQAFMLKGTAEELNQHFVTELGKAIPIYKGFKSNLEELEKEAKDKLAQKAAKKSTKKTDDDNGGEEETDENDGETGSGEAATTKTVKKPVKAKKTPKKVEKLMGNFNRATDVDMKEFCAKEIKKELETEKWDETEIRTFFETNKIYLIGFNIETGADQQGNASLFSTQDEKANVSSSEVPPPQGVQTPVPAPELEPIVPSASASIEVVPVVEYEDKDLAKSGTQMIPAETNAPFDLTQNQNGPAASIPEIPDGGFGLSIKPEADQTLVSPSSPALDKANFEEEGASIKEAPRPEIDDFNNDLF